MPAHPVPVFTAFTPLPWTRPPLAACPLRAGGLRVSAAATARALAVLLAAPGLMVRQPLARAGSPLAGCDYHAEARPYRELFAVPDLERDGIDPARGYGRGAAGRHITKTAFCWSLHLKLSAVAADPAGAWDELAAEAWAAFAADPGYAVELAAAGSRVIAQAAQQEALRQGARPLLVSVA